MVSYENSGQTISVRGAMQSLPYSSGLGMYQGENRWIVMSKMYWWAQEFQKLYPECEINSRFSISGVKYIVAYCNKDGLYSYKLNR